MMNKQVLDQLILQLEQQQIQDKEIVTEQIHTLFEKLTPFQLIKTAINDIVPNQNPGSSSIVQTIAGAAAGYISKKLFMGKSHNPIKEILGTMLEIKLARFLTKPKGEQ